MLKTEQVQKNKDDITTNVKNINNAPKSSNNPCFSCNVCNQMTQIHSPAGRIFLSESVDRTQGANMQKPCAINFFQRNLGNSYINSISGGGRPLRKINNGSGVPVIQRECVHSDGSISCNKED